MFRVKIAVFSVLISGAVLIAFGLFFLTVIGRVAMDRMDREVLTLGESQLHVWHPKEHWEDFDRSLRAGTVEPGLRIEKRIRPGVTIPADPDLIRMAILDLTANAVKYNIDGGLIRFHLTVDDNHARLTIANTGALIPDTERERIFERFHRLDRSRSRVPGTGLGLSLAREIVRAHRGVLHLEAAADNLNAFSLSLPCRG